MHQKHKDAILATMVIKTNILNYKESDMKEVVVRILQLKYDSVEERLENTRNMAWWITQHLRNCYRKLAVINARYHDTMARIGWVTTEGTMLSRIVFHMEKRVTIFRQQKAAEMVSIADWIEKFCGPAAVQEAKLDGQQETLIKEEINKLDRDRQNVTEFDALIEELLNRYRKKIRLFVIAVTYRADTYYIVTNIFLSLHAQNHLLAERVYLDAQLKIEHYGSDEAVRYNQQLIVIKEKLKMLQLSVIDSLKIGIQAKFDAEDEKNLQNYAFPNDSVDMLPDDMHKIEGVLLDTFTPTKHCNMMDFLRVYLVQPWLAEQSVEDVRLEESISSKAIQISTCKEQVTTLKNDIETGKQRVKDIEKLFKENADAQSMNVDAPEDESFLEKQKRMEVLEGLRAVSIELSFLCSWRYC